MKNSIEFLKKNWLVVILIAIVAVLLAGQLPTPVTVQRGGADLSFGGAELAKTSIMGTMPPIYSEVPPVSQRDRLVATNTNLSLKVNDVWKARPAVR